MSVTFTPRPMKDLLEFGGVNLPQYPPLRNSCITGERLRHAPLRKLDDGLPAAPRGKPKIKLRADMSIEELRAEMERKVQEDPSCRPKQEEILKQEEALRNADALTLKQKLEQLRNKVPEQTDVHALRKLYMDIRNFRRHYWLALGGAEAGKFGSKTAGSANLSNKQRRMSLLAPAKDEPTGKAGAKNPQARPAKDPSPPFMQSLALREKEIVARHFPYVDTNLPLDLLQSIALKDNNDIENAITRMTESRRAFHIVGLPGHNDGGYNRRFFAAENPDAPGRWLVYIDADSPVRSAKPNLKAARNIDEKPVDEALAETRRLGQQIMIRQRKDKILPILKDLAEEERIDKRLVYALLAEEPQRRDALLWQLTLDYAQRRRAAMLAPIPYVPPEDAPGEDAQAYLEAVQRLVEDRAKNGSRSFQKIAATPGKTAPRLTDAMPPDESVPDIDDYLEDTEMFSSSVGAPDALRYILRSQLGTGRNPSLTILSADESIMLNRLKGFEHLGYTVDHLTARYNMRDAVKRIGCDVTVVEPDPNNADEIRETLDSLAEAAVILEIEAGGDSYTMLWNADDPELGLKLGSGARFDGTPLAYWESAIAEMKLPLTRITRCVVSPSRTAIEIGLLINELVEKIQSDLAQEARAQGLASGTITGFEDLGHFLVSRYQNAISASYALGSIDAPHNTQLDSLLDRSPHGILLEYDDDNSGTGIVRVIFNVSGTSNDVFGQRYGDEDDELIVYEGRPSDLLNEIRREYGGTVRVLSTGPLQGEVIDSDRLQAAVTQALAFLVSVGLGFDPGDDEQKRAFVRCIFENYGGEPERITFEMYAKYAQQCNRTRTLEQQIQIMHRRVAAGPLDLGPTPYGSLLQFVDGGVTTVSFHADVDSGNLYFVRNLDITCATLATLLEQAVVAENWRVYSAIGVLQLNVAPAGKRRRTSSAAEEPEAKRRHTQDDE
jgi:hypothetical protein